MDGARKGDTEGPQYKYRGMGESSISRAFSCRELTKDSAVVGGVEALKI